MSEYFFLCITLCLTIHFLPSNIKTRFVDQMVDFTSRQKHYTLEKFRGEYLCKALLISQANLNKQD